MKYGIQRGLFANEAGMGSAPNAAATADVTHPAKQGFIQTIGVLVGYILSMYINSIYRTMFWCI